MNSFEIGQRLKRDLEAELGVSPQVSSAIVGNLAHETAGFKQLQEQKPIVPGSKGGYGIAQWTGPRRDQFESWSKEQGLDPSSYEANKGYLVHELTNTPEGRVLADLQGLDTNQATQAFSEKFLRPRPLL